MKELIIVICGIIIPWILGFILPELKALFYQLVMVIALLAWQQESYKNN